MRAATFLSIAIVAGAADAQVTLDAFGHEANVNRAVYPLTVGAGTNRALAVFVHVSSNCGEPNPTIDTVTYAGVPLIKVLTRPLTACSGTLSEMWALPAGTQPLPGTHEVDVRVSSAGITHRTIHSGAFSATAVDQVTTFTTTAANDGSGTTASVTLGANGANDLVIDSVCNGSSILSTPQVSRWLENESTNYDCNNSGGATASGGTTALSWSLNSDRWALLAAAFKAAGAQPVALDAVARTEGGTAVAYPLTVGASANRALAVFAHVGANCGLGQPNVAAITYAGVALTPIINLPAASCVGASAALWALPPGTQPTSGTNEVLVTLSGPLVRNGSVHSGAFSASGVDQATTFTTFGATDANRLPVTLTIAASAPEDLVVDSYCNGNSVIGTLQTQRWIDNVNSVNSCNNSGGATAPGGTTSLGWDGGHDHWILLAAAFKAAIAPDGGGSADAGGQDGGSSGDAGAPDGGTLDDGGTEDAGTPQIGPLTVGCGCSSSGGIWVVGALAAAALRRRRR